VAGPDGAGEVGQACGAKPFLSVLGHRTPATTRAKRAGPSEKTLYSLPPILTDLSRLPIFHVFLSSASRFRPVQRDDLLRVRMKTVMHGAAAGGALERLGRGVRRGNRHPDLRDES
jgi:hypothetical protein